MLQTKHLKDKPPHSHPEPLRERFNMEQTTERRPQFDGSFRARRYRGPQRQQDGGTNTAALSRIGREGLVSNSPTNTTSTVSATAAFSNKSSTTAAATIASAPNPAPYGIIGSHKRRRSSLLEEWTTPLSPSLGVSTSEGIHGAGSSAISSRDSKPASVIASPVTTPVTAQGTISKESATGMAPLPAPATVVERPATSAYNSNLATPHVAAHAVSLPVLTAPAASRNTTNPATAPSESPLTTTIPVPSATVATSPVAATSRDNGSSRDSWPAKDGKSSGLENSRQSLRGRKTEPTKSTVSAPASNVKEKKDTAGPSTASQTSPRRNVSHGLYKAPNGSTMTRIDLDRLSGGVKTVNRDTIYFRISFVENPWLGMKPIKTTCLERWW